MALKVLTSLHRRCLLELPKIYLTARPNERFVNNTSPTSRKFYKDEDRKKIKIFVIDKYLSYIKNYEQVLHKRFPKAMTLYRAFMDGVKLFYKDTKEFMKIVNIMNTSGNGINSLTRREIELYDRMPRDMWKVGPVLIVSTLPLANYVIFPLIFMFPKQTLTSHFWTEEQRDKFRTEMLAYRLSYNVSTLKHLETSVQNVPGEWLEIVRDLKNGKSPETEKLIAYKQLFVGRPFHLTYLSAFHVRCLVKVHDLHIGFARRSRLRKRARILKAMDHAISMEGGVHNLPDTAIANACLIRGLNPTGLSKEYQIEWLKKWMQISRFVDDDSLSLLLHAPLFLGLNEPSNKKLCNR